MNYTIRSTVVFKFQWAYHSKLIIQILFFLHTEQRNRGIKRIFATVKSPQFIAE